MYRSRRPRSRGGDEDLSIFNLRQVREDAERAAVLKVIARTNGNIARAAEILGVQPPSLYDLLSRFRTQEGECFVSENRTVRHHPRWSRPIRGIAVAAFSALVLVGCGETPEQISPRRSPFWKQDFDAAGIQLKNALQENANLAEARFLLGHSTCVRAMSLARSKASSGRSNSATRATRSPPNLRRRWCGRASSTGFSRSSAILG